MDLHYNAFISYKHAPADIAVAKDIQHRLEHFRVPKSIREKTGRDKIERIFRDQEELPITSDLNRDIAYALEDAEYLIVICSTNTKLSSWVPREIAKFLENHDRSKVLTVLVDGEPGEVIPEILRQEVVEEEDDFGEKRVVTRIFEPLSCDYRDIKNARKTEIPRLAAALLGCSYDELVMRARQYRRRRLTALASVIGALAVTAISYLLWSNAQIRRQYERAEENLREARRSQSVYLANEAMQALDREERILAAQLSLAALPSEERPDWPYVPLAEYALSRTIGAYTAPSSGVFGYEAVWDMQTRAAIEYFRVGPDEDTLAASDALGDVYVWSISEYRERFHLETGLDIKGLRVLQTGDAMTVFVEADDRLVALDAETGEERWVFQTKSDSEQREGYDGYTWYLSPDGIRAAAYLYGPGSCKLRILQLDPETGHPIWRSDWGEVPGRPSREAVLTEEGEALIFSCYVNGTYELQRCGLEDGSIRAFPVEVPLEQVLGMIAVPGGRIVIAGMEEGGGGTFTILSSTAVKRADIEVLCVDAGSGETVWREDFSCPGMNRLTYGNLLGQTEYRDPEGKTRQLLWCLYADEVHVYDLTEGSLYAEERVSAPIVGAAAYSSGDGLNLLLYSGETAVYRLHSEFTVCTPCFDKEVLQGTHFNRRDADQVGFVVKPDRDTLQIYIEMADEEGALLEGQYRNVSLLAQTAVSRTSFVSLESNSGSDGITMDVFDLENRSLRCSREIQTEQAFRYTLQGIVGAGEDATDGDGAAAGGSAADKDAAAAGDGAAAGEGQFAVLTCKDIDGTQLLTIRLSDGETADDRFLDQKEYGLADAVTFRGDTVWVLTDQYVSGNQKQYLLRSFRVDAQGIFSEESTYDLTEALSPEQSLYIKHIWLADDDSALLIDGRLNYGQDTEKLLLGWYRFADGTWVTPEETPSGELQGADVLLRQNSGDSSGSGAGGDSSGEDGRIILYTDTDVYAYRADGTLAYRHSETEQRLLAACLIGKEESGLAQDLLCTVTNNLQLNRYGADDGTFVGGSTLNYYEGKTGVTTFALLPGEDEWILRLDDVLIFLDAKAWTMKAATQSVAAYAPDVPAVVSAAAVDGGRQYMFFPHYTTEDIIRKGHAFLRGAEMSDSEKDTYGIGQ